MVLVGLSGHTIVSLIEPENGNHERGHIGSPMRRPSKVPSIYSFRRGRSVWTNFTRFPGRTLSE